jgi:hypothetical protein
MAPAAMRHFTRRVQLRKRKAIVKSLHLIAAMLAAGASVSAGAAVTVRDVVIENASFEEGALGDGQYFRTSIPGWSASGSGVGYFNPPQGAGFDATDGDTVINIDTYRNGDTADSTYSQRLGEIIAADTIYSLSVDAIRRDDVNIGPWFAEIFAADPGQQLTGTTLARGTVQDGDVAPGAFKTLTFSYTATAADAGKALGIRFRSVYDAQETPIRQVLLDNVRMTAASDLTAAVPEPATWAMMLVGFGMVGVSARRRRKVAMLTA